MEVKSWLDCIGREQDAEVDKFVENLMPHIDFNPGFVYDKENKIIAVRLAFSRITKDGQTWDAD